MTRFLEDLSLIDKTIEVGTAIVAALFIYVVGKAIARAITAMLRRAMKARQVDPTLTQFIGSVVYVLLLAAVVIAALGQLGVETTSLAAILAAAGLAIGLSLQSSLSSFASGVMIIAFRPFKVGDYVEAAGIAGTVEEVSIFTTHLKTPSNEAVIVPNSEITAGAITNYSAKPTRRLNLVFGIGYDDDIRKAKTIIEDIFDQDEKILNDPKPVVAVLELADSSVNLAVRPWVKSADYWDVHFRIHETVKLRFDEAGISIPFPQHDVHIDKEAA